MSRRRKSTNFFPVINPNVGGIDIASEEHWVAVPEDRDERSVRKFGCFTRDLHAIAHWLKKCGITSVAMESTGIYWIKLFDILESYGIEVILGNASHVKNVSGRKSDQMDCQWIMQLHACGLISASFQADSLTRRLRSYVRHRKTLIESSTQQVLRMQKSLELMNIKVHKVLSDILGKSGLNIIQAILNGERDAKKLSELVDIRVKASQEEIEKSLEAEWKEEYLFMVKQAYEGYNFYQGKIDECDAMIEQTLKEYGELTSKPEQTPKCKKKKKNSYRFDVDAYLTNAFGSKVTEIPGIDTVTGVTLLSEVGVDMSKWPTAKHFKAWLNLAPNTKTSGGKKISSKMMKKKNAAGQAFKMAAYGLSNHKGPLGDYLRRKKMQTDKATGIIATAAKLATIFYKMVKEKIAFNPEILKDGQQASIQKKIARLEKALLKTKLQVA